jgi:hypothetical protein
MGCSGVQVHATRAVKGITIVGTNPVFVFLDIEFFAPVGILRASVKLCMPDVRTMHGLLAYCAAPVPYPSFEGETQKKSKRAKEDAQRV